MHVIYYESHDADKFNGVLRRYVSLIIFPQITEFIGMHNTFTAFSMPSVAVVVLCWRINGESIEKRATVSVRILSRMDPALHS